MLRLFRSTNPYSVIALFIIALGLKLRFLIVPVPAAESPGQPFWSLIVQLIETIFGGGTFKLSLLAVFNLIFQALYLNKTAQDFHLFPYDSYLPALTFVLLTSFVPEWNYFSAFLFANWFLLAALRNLFRIYNQAEVYKSIFNVGAFVSLASILAFPNVVFLPVVFIGLSVLRPFHFREWAMAAFGFLTPLYFLLALLFLTDQLTLLNEVVHIRFHLPDVSITPKTIVLLGTFFLWFLFGLFYLNQFGSRMLVQIKKYWSVLLVAFGWSVLAVFWNVVHGFLSWIPTLFALSLIFTNLWFEERKRWVSPLIFYLLLAVIIFEQWIPLA